MKSARSFSHSLAVLAFLALTSFAVLAHAATAEGSFERNLAVTGPVNLEVKNGAGDIDLTAADAGSVRVVGQIKVRRGSAADAEEVVRLLESTPPIEQNGNHIEIGRIEDRSLRENVSISYTIVTPVQTTLESKTGSGNQKITGVHGPVEAHAGSGDLAVTEIAEQVEAHTGSGDIRLRQIGGAAETHTGSGDIEAMAVGGALEAKTGSGDVMLEQSGEGRVDIATGSGDVQASRVRGPLEVRTASGDIELQGEPTGEWNLRAASGGITVRLPTDAAFDLRARASSGITVDHPLEAATQRKNHVEGKVRGGGPLLDIATASGTIRIE